MILNETSFESACKMVTVLCNSTAKYPAIINLSVKFLTKLVDITSCDLESSKNA